MDIVEYRTVADTWSPPQLDYLKNDFQNAVRRNLHIWTKWRTRLNDNLIDAVTTGTQLNNVEPFRQCLNRDAPDPDHPTSNPKTLMMFSASAESSTNLHTKDFYKYGIPRAKVDPRLQTASHLGVEEDGKQQLEAAVEATPVYRLVVDGCSSQGDDDLVMDYFNFQDSPPASSGTARRFHRSAATLPVTPVPEVGKDRRTDKTKKTEERRRLPPSYVEPFLGSRIITARRDHNVMYTRSACHLDQL